MDLIINDLTIKIDELKLIDKQIKTLETKYNDISNELVTISKEIKKQQQIKHKKEKNREAARRFYENHKDKVKEQNKLNYYKKKESITL